MKVSTIKYIALFNLFLGLSLLLSGWVNELSCYRFFEDTFYKWVLVVRGELKSHQVSSARAERVQLIYSRDGNDFQGPVQWEVTPYEKAPEARLFLVEVGEDPDKVFCESPPAAMDFAVIFYQLHELGADKVSVTASLSWPSPPNPVETDALTYEIAAYNKAVLGLVMSPSARKMTLPKAMESLVLQPDQVKGSIGSLVGVGRVVDPPQVQSDKAISIAPMRVETESETVESAEGRKLVLFVRWGNYVLPTLPLVTALNSLGLKPSDIKVQFGGQLSLGGKRILPIDETGCITLQPDMGNGVVRIPATKLVPMQDVPHDVRLQSALANSQAVILGEGKTPLESLDRLDAGSTSWNWDQSLDVTAAGVQALLQGLAPGKSVGLNRLGRLGQLIVLFDVLLLGTWALTFSVWRRRVVLALLIAALFATGMVMASFFHLWLPMTPSVIGLLLILLVSLLIKRHSELAPASSPEEGSDSDVEALCPVPPPVVEVEEKAGKVDRKPDRQEVPSDEKE